jgi:hypothetical protein
MLIVLLLVLGGLGFMVLKLLNRITDRTEKNAETAASAQKSAETTQIALANAGADIKHALAENTGELKQQTGLMGEQVDALRQVLRIVSALPGQVDAAGEKTTAELSHRLDAQNVVLARVETGLAALADKYENGARIRHSEVVDLLRALRADVASLSPIVPTLPAPISPPELKPPFIVTVEAAT